MLSYYSHCLQCSHSMQTGVPAILLGTHGTRIIIHGKRGVCPWLRSKEKINENKDSESKQSKPNKSKKYQLHATYPGFKDGLLRSPSPCRADGGVASLSIGLSGCMCTVRSGLCNMACDVCHADWKRCKFKKCDLQLHLLTCRRGKHNCVFPSHSLPRSRWPGFVWVCLAIRIYTSLNAHMSD